MKNIKKNLTLIFLTLVLIFLNADNNVLNPNISIIEKEFGVNDADIGLMMGLFTIVGAIISLIWGYFADKSSRKKLFIACVLLGEIPCIGTAFAPNYQTFFILRILTGIGVGAAFPLVFSIIGDIFDENNRAKATAIATTAFSIGNILGILLGGFTATINTGYFTGWRFPFLLASAPNIPLIILFAFLIPEPSRAASEDALKELIEKGIVYPRTIHFSDYINLAKIKTNVYLFIQGILGTIPWGATAFFNKFLEDYKGLPKIEATFVFLIFALGMIFGNIYGGIWGGKIFLKDQKKLPQFCSITTVIGCIMAVIIFLFIPSNIILLSLFGFITTFFVSLTGPNMRKMLLDTNVPENRGAIFSIFNLTDSVGTGIGKYIAGILSILVGLKYSLTICFLFWIGCAIFLWIVSYYFPSDVKALHKKMEEIALELKGK